jgi:hypothetical protein
MSVRTLTTTRPVSVSHTDTAVCYFRPVQLGRLRARGHVANAAQVADLEDGQALSVRAEEQGVCAGVTGRQPEKAFAAGGLQKANHAPGRSRISAASQVVSSAD